MTASSFMPLLDAACKAKLSRDAVMRLITVGTLEGRQRPNGRWDVNSASLDSYLRERQQAADAMATTMKELREAAS